VTRPPRRTLDERATRLAAADLLSRKPWTRADLAARLRRRGAPAETAIAIVADLSARGHLDDAAFAQNWVAVRSARGYGAARLRTELRARGVATALIDAALATVRDDGVDERAREIARRRLPALQRLEARTGSGARVAARLRDYLMRRGYSGSVATRVAREVTGVSAGTETDAP